MTSQIGAIRLADMTQFKAPRPKFTAMAIDRYTELTGRHPRTWQEAVAEYVWKKFRG
jgi:dTDP-4-dehydrorhamnose reductase